MIILLKEFIKLSATMDNKIKTVKLFEINTKNVNAVLNTKTLKITEENRNVYSVIGNTK